MKYGKAFGAGVLGAVVMTALMAMARAMGMPVNLEMVLGTMMGGAPSLASWIMGFIIHLMAGGIFALIYAVGFEYWTHCADWLVGLGFGVIHTLFSSVLLAMIPAMHPLVPEQMPAPGPFMSNLGMMGVLAFFMLHLIYGAIVGAMYGPVIHSRWLGASRRRGWVCSGSRLSERSSLNGRGIIPIHQCSPGYPSRGGTIQDARYSPCRMSADMYVG
jgi:hypothetical protein